MKTFLKFLLGFGLIAAFSLYAWERIDDSLTISRANEITSLQAKLSELVAQRSEDLSSIDSAIKEVIPKLYTIAADGSKEDNISNVDEAMSPVIDVIEKVSESLSVESLADEDEAEPEDKPHEDTE